MNKKRKILDLGCGTKKIRGAVGLDRVKLPGVDIVHDMNTYPYPVTSNSMDAIYCYHILEHVEDMIKTMEEIYRIGKNGATVHIRGPHASCNSAVWIDPTHKRGLSIRMFSDYFSEEGSWSFYTKTNFIIKKIQLNYVLSGGHSRIPRIVSFTLSFFANINLTGQLLCERLWSYWVGGFEEIEVILTIKKDKK